MLFYVFFQGPIFIFWGADFQVKIGPVIAGGDHIRRPEHKDINNIIPYFPGGRGSKCADYRTDRKTVNKFHDL